MRSRYMWTRSVAVIRRERIASWMSAMVASTTSNFGFDFGGFDFGGFGASFGFGFGACPFSWPRPWAQAGVAVVAASRQASSAVATPRREAKRCMSLVPLRNGRATASRASEMPRSRCTSAALCVSARAQLDRATSRRCTRAARARSCTVRHRLQRTGSAGLVDQEALGVAVAGGGAGEAQVLEVRVGLALGHLAPAAGMEQPLRERLHGGGSQLAADVLHLLEPLVMVALDGL